VSSSHTKRPKLSARRMRTSFNHFCAALKTMDSEATSTFRYTDGHDWPSGLRQYHGHYNTVHGSRLTCEPSWSQRLVELLQPSYPGCRAERSYPGNGDRCDVVIPVKPSLSTWVRQPLTPSLV
jgi:hypothetical protein